MLSALVSAPFEYLSACRGSHSLSESVNFASLSLFGLISSFHSQNSDIFCILRNLFILRVFYILHFFLPSSQALFDVLTGKIK